DVGDLGVVRLVLRRVRLRRTIRLVRIVEMDPRQPREWGRGDLGTGGLRQCRSVGGGQSLRLSPSPQSPSPLCGSGAADDPRGGGADDVFSPPLGVSGVTVPIVVDVEAAVEAEARVEDEGADERAGAVARALEDRR